MPEDFIPVSDLQKNGTVSIIVVEDEALIRMIAADAFAQEGFDVLEAINAQEAIALLQSQASRIHVVFTDVNMPGPMDGFMLARYVRQNWPWVGMIVASGRCDPVAAELPPHSVFIPKPYDLRRVIGHIKELARAA